MMSNSLRKKIQNEKDDGHHSQSNSAKQSQCSDASTSNDVNTTNSQKSNSTRSIASNKNPAIPQSKKLEMLRRFQGINKSEPDNSEPKSVAPSNNSNQAILKSEKRSPIVAKSFQSTIPSSIALNEHSG